MQHLNRYGSNLGRFGIDEHDSFLLALFISKGILYRASRITDMLVDHLRLVNMPERNIIEAFEYIFGNSRCLSDSRRPVRFGKLCTYDQRMCHHNIETRRIHLFPDMVADDFHCFLLRSNLCTFFREQGDDLLAVKKGQRVNRCIPGKDRCDLSGQAARHIKSRSLKQLTACCEPLCTIVISCDHDHLFPHIRTDSGCCLIINRDCFRIGNTAVIHISRKQKDICLFFFYVLIINSTRTHFEIQKGFSLMPGKSIITNFRNVLTDANIPVVSGIRNSLLVSACSAALSVYFSALTAYGIYAYNFKFKKAAFALILLIMTMPTQVSALGFLQLISKMGLKNSFIPLIVPSIAAPTVFFFMKQYLDASLPMEIVEAARIDGAGEFYTFNKIVLPIMKPALAVQAIFSFVASWNNYFIPALVLDTADKKTLPILIAQLRSADFLKFDMGKVYMMVAIAILPVIVVYLLLSKFIVRGVALGGVKG